MTTLRAMTVLQVSDVSASIAFYQRAGFALNGAWKIDDGSDEVTFAIIQRGQVTVGLQLLRGPLSVNTHWAAYVYVDDIDAIHAELVAEGLEPTEISRHTDYACDDFDLRDPDGHLIAFGHDRSGEHGPGMGADGGKG